MIATIEVDLQSRKLPVRAKTSEMYNREMPRHVIHMSENEAVATDVATLLAHVRAGAEIVIESNMRPLAIVHSAEPERRTVSECIALLPEDSTATIDSEFARDVEAAIESHREPLTPPVWE